MITKDRLLFTKKEKIIVIFFATIKVITIFVAYQQKHPYIYVRNQKQDSLY